MPGQPLCPEPEAAMTRPPQALEALQLDTGAGTRLFHFRTDSTDRKVVDQVFKHQQYDLRRSARFVDLLGFLKTLRESGRRPLIIDAGANIGAASVFMAINLPRARIIAIEPEAGNFAMLTRNVAGLDVHCVQAALAAQPGHTRVADPGMGEWAYRTAPDGTGPEVPAVTVAQLLAEHGDATLVPFLVKIDIEGGERDLFSANTGWLASMPLVIVELHDWMLPRQGTAAPFLRCVAGLDRDFVLFGESVFSIDNAIRDALPAPGRDNLPAGP